MQKKDDERGQHDAFSSIQHSHYYSQPTKGNTQTYDTKIQCNIDISTMHLIAHIWTLLNAVMCRFPGVTTLPYPWRCQK
ncbi:hypothetical protein D3C73_698310 [compost metagenome]